VREIALRKELIVNVLFQCISGVRSMGSMLTNCLPRIFLLQNGKSESRLLQYVSYIQIM